MDGQGPIFTGQDLPTLRRPNISMDETEILPTDLHKNNEISSTDSIVSKSKLSAEAKEFVPKGIYSPMPTNKSVQSRLDRSRSQQQAPQSNNINSASQLPSDINNGSNFNDYFNELEHLREVIVLLTSNPGKFDEKVPALLDNLRTCLDDSQMMDAVVQCIVDQAISEHNFGYSGARLFVILNAYSSQMRLCLMNYCDSFEFTAPHSDKARNYTLFLAELFSQLDWDETFGEYLLKMLQVLLSFDGPDDIKCICQVLKLTGMSLERLKFDAVLSIINRLQDRLPDLPTSCANLLKCVLDLRATQWGRSNMHQPSTIPTITHSVQSDYPPESPFVQRWSDGGPVFYGPDGLELSAEENEFLTDVADEISHNDDSDPDGLWDPDPEMDEEMRAAFKEFVAMGKK